MRAIVGATARGVLTGAALIAAACNSGSSSSSESGGSGPTSPSGSGAVARWLEPDMSNNTHSPSLAVDANGGIHVVSAVQGGTLKARYAYCASSCTDAKHWRTTDIGGAGTTTTGGPLAHPTLALDPNGHPRALWVYDDAAYGPIRWVRAACDADDCTAPDSWSVTELRQNTGIAKGDPSQSGYYAIDPNGSEAFIYEPDFSNASDYTGLRYAQCDSNCGSPASWRTVALPVGASLNRVGALVFDGPGRPRAAFVSTPDGKQNGVVYAQCDDNCLSPSSWRAIAFTAAGSDGQVALHADPGGKMRLAAAVGSAGELSNRVALWGCDADCGTPKSWSAPKVFATDAFVPLSIAMVGDGQGGLGLAVTGQGATNHPELHVLACAADCTNDSATWKEGLVESGESLDKSDPTPHRSSCSTSAWAQFQDVTLAYDAGKVRIAVGAMHAQGGFPRPCTTNGECGASAVCSSGKCSDKSCSFQADMYLNRVYLLE